MEAMRPGRGRTPWRILAAVALAADATAAVLGLLRGTGGILDAAFSISFGGFAVVGMAITERDSDHPMGRLLLGFAVLG